MPLRWLASWLGTHSLSSTCAFRSRWILLLVFVWLSATTAMTPHHIAELRREAVDMFYHGYDNYMRVAFPEDEVRPVSCIPMTRDRENPLNVVANDPLGNYSLTLIDSLSTLAVLASAPPDKAQTGAKALRDFQDGVAALVLQYGDGTKGKAGKGLKTRGFDLDSKVQVFETVIRGVGGLLSAHLFASGELPIKGYEARASFSSGSSKLETSTVLWPNGFKYNGQLLRLALDLSERLLPAFFTTTGLPYPRVNLRTGVPFYFNSPLHAGQGPNVAFDAMTEPTETCSAGAGSLLLEFTTLSQLIDDPRFEQVAKRAFWAVWSRRSKIGLLGAAIDAETGHWIGPYSGIGAGTDSFFEYAFKMSILLSGQANSNLTIPSKSPPSSRARSIQMDPELSLLTQKALHLQHSEMLLDPNTMYNPLSEEENSANAFLQVWQQSHASIKRHLYSKIHHPHYVNVHLATGSPQAYWIDALGAFYPGLLTQAGEVEEAVEIHLLYAALWMRFSAIPERWNIRDGRIEGGLGWWLGRPEFIESNYHLYRATHDPYYLYVGEMVLKDIKERCWATCGWSGIQDVTSGDLNDRMESFFLGETVKYLYLTFDQEHPLHSLDASWVFSTEGHPLIIPRPRQGPDGKLKKPTAKDPLSSDIIPGTCPAPPVNLPLSISVTAARDDIFHASTLIGLNLALGSDPSGPGDSLHPSSRMVDVEMYPYTLPSPMIPANGTCARMIQLKTFTVEFPTSHPVGPIQVSGQNIARMNEGLLIRSLSGLKIGMVLDSVSSYLGSGISSAEAWRVHSVSNIVLGRDEQVFIPRDVVGNIMDQSFARIRDPIILDIVLQMEDPREGLANLTHIDGVDRTSDDEFVPDTIRLQFEDGMSASMPGLADEYRTILNSLLEQMTAILQPTAATSLAAEPSMSIPPAYRFTSLPAITSTGIGAIAPLFDLVEAPDPHTISDRSLLSWTSFYFAGQGCHKLPDEAVRHQIIIFKRGGCTFSEKLATIPSFMPSEKGVQLAVVVSDDAAEQEDSRDDAEHKLIRPFLDEEQKTSSGLLRANMIPMIMVGGGSRTIEMLRSARSCGLRRRYHVETQGIVVGNIVIV